MWWGAYRTFGNSAKLLLENVSDKVAVKEKLIDKLFILVSGKTSQGVVDIFKEVVVPKGMSSKALVREAAFYSIDFPLIDTHPSLSFVTGIILEFSRNEAKFKDAVDLKVAPRLHTGGGGSIGWISAKAADIYLFGVC